MNGPWWKRQRRSLADTTYVTFANFHPVGASFGNFYARAKERERREEEFVRSKLQMLDNKRDNFLTRRSEDHVPIHTHVILMQIRDKKM